MYLGDFSDSVLSRLFMRRHDVAEHSIRTAEIAFAMGRELALADTDLFDLTLAAGLHDIGKVAMPPRILDKAGSLTDTEWAQIRLHPVLGHRVVNTIYALRNTAPAVLHHHERWDGQGYPYGLKASITPLASRIISIADAYDAMTHPRTYRKQLSVGSALSELRMQAGTQFDPNVVHACIHLMPHLLEQPQHRVGVVKTLMEQAAAAIVASSAWHEIAEAQLTEVYD